MASIICPKCGFTFEGNDKANLVSRAAASVACGASGAYIGSSIGVATGGTAMPATIPLAIGGAALGYLGASKFRRCASCTKVFKI